MREQLAALVRLAQIDIAARESEEELEKIPSHLQELQDDVKRLEELLSAERNQVEEAESLFQAQEEGIREQTQALARSKAKAAKARTMREVDAAEREMETLRRMLREREAERERLKEAIEQRGAVLKQHDEELRELMQYVAGEEKKTAERMKTLTDRRNGVLAGRDEVVAQVPAALARRYETIRSKRGGVGVVEIKSDSCGGCNVLLPPQQVNAIQRSETVEQCPRCQRILYWPDAFAAPSQPEEEAG